jgi:hypothetical protein
MQSSVARNIRATSLARAAALELISLYVLVTMDVPKEASVQRTGWVACFEAKFNGAPASAGSGSCPFRPE